MFVSTSPVVGARLPHGLSSACKWGGPHWVSNDSPPRPPLFKGVGGMFSSVFFIPLAPLKRGRLTHHLYSICRREAINCAFMEHSIG